MIAAGELVTSTAAETPSDCSWLCKAVVLPTVVIIPCAAVALAASISASTLFPELLCSRLTVDSVTFTALSATPAIAAIAFFAFASLIPDPNLYDTATLNFKLVISTFDKSIPKLLAILSLNAASSKDEKFVSFSCATNVVVTSAAAVVVVAGAGFGGEVGVVPLVLLPPFP
mmetsp:Transcript_108214/g.336381  ORF Transcript_108214/g.336381 Transcript_108214/m.336381 type:complete len:172 (+) Transcript_108214:365-880(+)